MSLETVLIGYGAAVHLFAWVGIKTVGEWADQKLDAWARRPKRRKRRTGHGGRTGRATPARE